MLQNDLEQVLRQIGDKDQKIQNLEALLQKSKDIVSQLEAERDDLCAKIQAGEGETAVLNQLKEKNQALQGQVGKCTPILCHKSPYKPFLSLNFYVYGFYRLRS